MTTVPARPAGPADLAAVEALVAAAYAKWPPRLGVDPLPMSDDYAARVAAGQVWVVDRDTCPDDAPDDAPDLAPDVAPDVAAGGVPDAVRLAGLVVLVEHVDHLEVDNVAVHPDVQGRGLGRALLDLAAEQAVRAGLDELRLMTHELMTENRALYERLGWVETGRVERSGRRAVRYALRLGRTR